MKTLSLNSFHDIHIDEKGNIATVDEIEALRQRIMTKLKMLQGEWPLDMTQGIPYYQDIFVIGASDEGTANILNTAILEFDEVVSIIESASYIDQSSREFGYFAKIESVYGQTEVSI